jgi:hypothetical protein
MRRFALILTSILMVISTIGLAYAVEIGDDDISDVEIEKVDLFTFLELDDTPSSYAGADGLCTVVNETAGTLYFTDCSNATGGGGAFNNTNVAYLNNTQTFTGSNTFSENISFSGHSDCIRWGSGQEYICSFGTGDLRILAEDQFELINTKPTGVIKVNATNFTYNDDEVCTGANGVCGLTIPEYAEVSGWNFTDYVIFNQILVDAYNVSFINDSNNIRMITNVEGENYFGISTDGAFLQLYANPNPSVDYLMFTVSETQGADTEINFYEGGVGHNRFWDSGSARFGGGADYLCSNLTTEVDCDTAGTGADVVIQDDLWIGDQFFGEKIYLDAGTDVIRLEADGGQYTQISTHPLVFSPAKLTLPFQSATVMGTTTAETVSGIKSFTATSTSINVAQRITHHSDTDTYIEFTGNSIDMYGGGNNFFSMDNDGAKEKVTLNNDGDLTDFFIKDSNGAQYFKADASGGLRTNGGHVQIGGNKLSPSNYDTQPSLDVNGNLTNGVCGNNFAFVLSAFGSHSSGTNWLNGLITNNDKGHVFLCDGVITGMTVSGSVDPSTNDEIVHVELDNVDANCQINVTASEGNDFGLTNSTCEVGFSAGTGLTVSGDFASGVSITDGVAVVYGRFTYGFA